MEKKSTVITFRNNIDSLIMGLLSGIFIYTLIKFHGIGISPDSVSYTAVARNMVKGNGITDFNGKPLIIFPATYPIFLSAISFIFSKDVLLIASIINATLIAIVVFLTGCILQKITLKHVLYKWAVLSTLPISYCIMEVYTMLWSETLFIYFSLLFLVLLFNYVNRPTTIKLIIVALITAIACDTRIAGISILATGLFFIIINQNISVKYKIIHSIIFGLISVSLLVINLIRNQVVDGTATGIRLKSDTPLIKNIDYFGNTVFEWMHLQLDCYSLSLFIAITIILLMGLFKLRLLLIKKKTHNLSTIILSFTVIYIAFIIITSSISKYETINNRLLSPAFIPFVLSCSLFFPWLMHHIRNVRFRFFLVAFIVILYLTYQYKQYNLAHDFYEQTKENGIPGYTEMGWQESKMVQMLEKKQPFFKTNIPIYSNAADAVYFYSSLLASTIPEITHTQEIKSYTNQDPHYVVWFTNEFDNKQLLRREVITKYRSLDTLLTFDDGVIYWSKKKPIP